MLIIYKIIIFCAIMDCMSCAMNVLPTKEEIVAQIMKSMGIKCPDIVRDGFVQRDLR